MPCRRQKKQVRLRGNRSARGSRLQGPGEEERILLGRGALNRSRRLEKASQARVPPRAEPSPGQCPGLTACSVLLGARFGGIRLCGGAWSTEEGRGSHLFPQRESSRPCQEHRLAVLGRGGGAGSSRSYSGMRFGPYPDRREGPPRAVPRGPQKHSTLAPSAAWER